MSAKKSPRSRATPPRNSDRVAAPVAAGIVGLRYPDEFNNQRFALEEPFDPNNPDVVLAIPEEYRLTLLSRGAERALRTRAGKTEEQIAGDLENLRAYEAKKEARMRWSKAQWMRVRPWGGRKTPHGDWWYSAEACQRWCDASTGHMRRPKLEP